MLLGPNRRDLDAVPLQLIEKIKVIEGSNPSLSAISPIKTAR